MDLRLIGLQNFPMVVPDDDVAGMIIDSVMGMSDHIQDDDVIVIAQKIISKTENRYLDLRRVEPSEKAIELSLIVDKDAKKVQAVLDESNDVVRTKKGVLIVEHKLGFVQANAGIDQSNISHDGDEDDYTCLRLPINPDLSAEKIRKEIQLRLGVSVGVIINDSLGRAWRNGSLGLAIGVAGFTALEDYVGQTDIYGRELLVTQVAAADELAAGASLVMGQTTQKTPVVLVRGYKPSEPSDPSLRGVQPLIRAKEEDLFR